mmetsp:Transcript_6884/g.12397  ORF Transcript_6884/g.12397 Transcript_6884/m.12397 type:complete len:349 (-) Transcript_6884:12-1058(-)
MADEKPQKRFMIYFEAVNLHVYDMTFKTKKIHTSYVKVLKENANASISDLFRTENVYSSNPRWTKPYVIRVDEDQIDNYELPISIYYKPHSAADMMERTSSGRSKAAGFLKKIFKSDINSSQASTSDTKDVLFVAEKLKLKSILNKEAPYIVNNLVPKPENEQLATKIEWEQNYLCIFVQEIGPPAMYDDKLIIFHPILNEKVPDNHLQIEIYREAKRCSLGMYILVHKSEWLPEVADKDFGHLYQPTRLRFIELSGASNDEKFTMILFERNTEPKVLVERYALALRTTTAAELRQERTVESRRTAWERIHNADALKPFKITDPLLTESGDIKLGGIRTCILDTHVEI